MTFKFFPTWLSPEGGGDIKPTNIIKFCENVKNVTLNRDDPLALFLKSLRRILIEYNYST